MVLTGSLLLIIGGFLPWISVPVLFGISGPFNEGIEIGWEGDSVITIGSGLILIFSELLFRKATRRWITLTKVLLAALSAFVVLSDFRRILELAPEAGFFAATDIGIHMTLIGALLALIGCITGRVPHTPQQETAATNPKI